MGLKSLFTICTLLGTLVVLQPSAFADSGSILQSLSTCIQHPDDEQFVEASSGVCQAHADPFGAIVSGVRKVRSTIDDPGEFIHALQLEGLRNVVLNYARELQSEGKLSSAADAVKAVCEQTSQASDRCPGDAQAILTRYLNSEMPILKRTPVQSDALQCEIVQKEFSRLNSILETLSVTPVKEGLGISAGKWGTQTLKNYIDYQVEYQKYVSSYPGALVYTDALKHDILDPTDGNMVTSLDVRTSCPYATGCPLKYVTKLHGNLSCSQNGVQKITAARTEIKQKLLQKAVQLNNDGHNRDEWLRNPAEAAKYLATHPSQAHTGLQFLFNGKGAINTWAMDQIAYDSPVALGYLLAQHPEYKQEACDTLNRIGHWQKSTLKNIKIGTYVFVTAVGAVITIADGGTTAPEEGAMLSAAAEVANGGQTLARVMSIAKIAGRALPGALTGAAVADTLVNGEEALVENVELSNTTLDAWGNNNYEAHKLAEQKQTSVGAHRWRELGDLLSLPLPIGIISKLAQGARNARSLLEVGQSASRENAIIQDARDFVRASDQEKVESNMGRFYQVIADSDLEKSQQEELAKALVSNENQNEARETLAQLAQMDKITRKKILREIYERAQSCHI